MSEKRKFLVFRILCILLLSGYFADAQKVNTVVLDAGHGGYDTGGLGKHSREKDITLAIILKLRDYIHENLKDVNVILTRDTDDFVELYRRAKIANENNADLFISVHCNSNPSPTPFGTETYVMGLHKSNANLAVAKAENAAILLEYDYVAQYDGFDPYSAEGNIFFSMMQNAFLDKSLDFAGRVEKQFREKLNFFDRGVKQAGFLVLYKTAMPGVLVETGFLSNARDEKFLLSEKGQDQTAYAIFRAFREYKFAIEKRDLSSMNIVDSTLVNNKVKKTAIVEAKAEPVADNSINKPKPEPAQEKIQNKPKQEPSKEKTQNKSKSEPAQEKIQNKPKSEITPGKIAAKKVVYRVQFASSSIDEPLDAPEFKNLPDVWKYYQNGLYKFTTGKFDTARKAAAFRLEVVNRGFKDAFVVPFYNDQRITIDEALRLGGK
jgi:N-acetylmuramoyl-L-alanine amidase